MTTPAAEASAVLIDPHVPTRHRPGSEEKIRVLEARRALGLPLFLEGDALGTRQLNTVEPSPIRRRSAVERRLILLLNGEERPDKELARLVGCEGGQRVLKALWLLRDAGIAVKGPRGWKLAEVQV